MTILFAILIFSLLIFVHELGHFVAAKLSGVQVNEFSMFMGPAIYKKQMGETLYAIRCIPMGGYCAMEGEDADTDNPRSFQKAAWWKRLIILVAGAAMNFVTGVLIMVLVYAPAKQVIVPTISEYEPGCVLFEEGGLQVGDTILEVNGEKVYVSSDVTTLLAIHGSDVHDLVVERNGREVVLENFSMPKMEFPNPDGTTSLRYGFSFSIAELDLGGKLAYAWKESINTVRTVRLSLQMLISGKAGLKDMTGPVGLVSLMNETAQASPTALDAVLNVLYLGGFIAINLAVMNLLPIPALDGGRVVGVVLSAAFEAVTHKKLDPKYEGYIHGAGMILLLALMAFIMFKDILTIFRG